MQDKNNDVERLKAMVIPRLEAILAELPASARICFMVWTGDQIPVVLNGNCTMEDSMDAMLLAATKGNRVDTDSSKKFRRLIT